KAPPLAVELSEADLQARLTTLLRQGLSRSEASRQLAQETHLPKREVYQIAIALPDPHEGDRPQE
ncbi:MAG TPA: hypothetical protein V6D02_08085, partial [Candidatus Obscuribacterales bacterium]